jgi:hypothetical protein
MVAMFLIKKRSEYYLKKVCPVNGGLKCLSTMSGLNVLNGIPWFNHTSDVLTENIEILTRLISK